MESNAIVASKIAMALANPTKQLVTNTPNELNKNETSYTFSVYNLSKSKAVKNETNLSLLVIEVAKNTLSIPNSHIQNEINKSTLIHLLFISN